MNKKIITSVLIVLIGIAFFNYQKTISSDSKLIQSDNHEVLVEKIEDTIISDVNKSGNRSQINNTDEIDFEIIFMNPSENDEVYWAFKMYTNTHSVNLDEIPFADKIHFIDDTGQKIDGEIKFEKRGSGHHLEQYIKLPKQVNDRRTILKEFKSLKLVISDIDDIDELIFEWDLTLYPNLFDY